MRMTPRLVKVLAILVGALVVILAASRELRLTARDQAWLLISLVAGRPDPFSSSVLSGELPKGVSAELRRHWQWLVLEGVGARLARHGAAEPDRVGALSRALRAAPADRRTMIRCQLAIAYAQRMGTLRPELATPRERLRRPRPPANPSVAPQVIDHASAAWKAEPDNALYPQLIAGAYLAQHRDADALHMLERAASLERWSNHRREVEEAVIEAWRLQGKTRVFAKAGTSFEGLGSEVVTRVAATAALVGHQARQAGDNALAIRWYGAVFGMEPQMLRSGGMAALGIAGAVAAPFGPSLHLRGRGLYDPLVNHAEEILAFGRLYDYLVEHGADKLAEQALVAAGRSKAVRDMLQMDWGVRGAFSRYGPWRRYMSWWAGQWLVLLCLVVLWLVVCIVAAAIAGLVTLAARRLRGRRIPADAGKSSAVLVARIVLVVVPIAVVASLLPWVVVLVSSPPVRFEDRISLLAILEAAIALIVVVGATTMVEKWISRRESAEPGLMARWFPSMRAVLARASAALLALYLVMFIPVGVYGARWERQLDRGLREAPISESMLRRLFLGPRPTLLAPAARPAVVQPSGKSEAAPRSR